jgi:hypothetical protein
MRMRTNFTLYASLAAIGKFSGDACRRHAGRTVWLLCRIRR